MENDKNIPPPKKTLWPWLLLLALTLIAIYTWNTAIEIVDDISRNMPDAIIDLFNDLLRKDSGRTYPHPVVDVVQPVSEPSR